MTVGSSQTNQTVDNVAVAENTLEHSPDYNLFLMQPLVMTTVSIKLLLNILHCN